MNRMHGFTLIELVMVLAIAALLSSMSLPAVLSSLRRAGVDGAVSQIERIAMQARLRSLTVVPEQASDVAVAYGVIIGCQDGRGFTGVIRGWPGDGKADDLARLVPESRRDLPANTVVTVGGADLAGSGPACIAWYYRPVTGSPMIMDGSRWSPGMASIGFTPTVAATSLWGIPGYNLNLDAVAGAGLEVRSPDGAYRQSLRVMSSGALVVREVVTP
jgi:prepilin-type N-terminal cleavage/methylation domain-containing protein